MIEEESVAVACYAGHRYPQRPRRVLWRGAWQEVAAVEREWQEPGRRLFLVRLVGGERLRLTYDQAEDCWTATPHPLIR
ncbi:MAG: hypothetical protein ACE5IZ_10810 [Dehalococcoidia bacterium]